MENISEVDWQLRLDQFQDDLALAQKKHSTSLATYSKKPGDIDERIIFYMNATTRLCIDVARAAERMGAIGAVEQMREQMRKKILEFWHEAPKIDLGVAGDRIASVSVAYSDDVRWSLAGSGSMVNALWFAAWHEFGNSVALDVE